MTTLDGKKNMMTDKGKAQNTWKEQVQFVLLMSIGNTLGNHLKQVVAPVMNRRMKAKIDVVRKRRCRCVIAL